jgi:hypothetical protein
MNEPSNPKVGSASRSGAGPESKELDYIRAEMVTLAQSVAALVGVVQDLKANGIPTVMSLKPASDRPSDAGIGSANSSAKLNATADQLETNLPAELRKRAQCTLLKETGKSLSKVVDTQTAQQLELTLLGLEIPEVNELISQLQDEVKVNVVLGRALEANLLSVMLKLLTKQEVKLLRALHSGERLRAEHLLAHVYNLYRVEMKRNTSVALEIHDLNPWETCFSLKAKVWKTQRSYSDEDCAHQLVTMLRNVYNLPVQSEISAKGFEAVVQHVQLNHSMVKALGRGDSANNTQHQRPGSTQPPAQPPARPQKKKNVKCGVCNYYHKPDIACKRCASGVQLYCHVCDMYNHSTQECGLLKRARNLRDGAANSTTETPESQISK